MLPTPAKAASCANQGREAAGIAMLPFTSGRERTPSLVRHPLSSSTSSAAASLAVEDEDASASLAGGSVPAAGCPWRAARVVAWQHAPGRCFGRQDTPLAPWAENQEEGKKTPEHVWTHRRLHVERPCGELGAAEGFRHESGLVGAG